MNVGSGDRAAGRGGLPGRAYVYSSSPESDVRRLCEWIQSPALDRLRRDADRNAVLGDSLLDARSRERDLVARRECPAARLTRHAVDVHALAGRDRANRDGDVVARRRIANRRAAVRAVDRIALSALDRVAPTGHRRYVSRASS